MATPKFLQAQENIQQNSGWITTAIAAVVNQINSLTFGAIAGKPSVYPTDIANVQGLQSALEAKLSAALAATLYKSADYSPDIRSGTINILAYNANPTASVRYSNGIFYIDLGIPAGQPGPPGSTAGTVTAVNGQTVDSGTGNVSLTTDLLPEGTNATRKFYKPSDVAATDTKLATKAGKNDFGKSMLQTSASVTGTTDASNELKALIAGGGDVYLAGATLAISQRIDLPSNLRLWGGTILVGAGLSEVFWATGQSNINLDRLTFNRASGNTGDPISLHIAQCQNVEATRFICNSVLGPSTYRPAYSTASSSSLCKNIRFNDHSIYNVGNGPYQAAMALNFCEDVQAHRNLIDGAANGIMWWGGDGNPSNGQNNLASTAPKWARRIKADDNIIKNVVAGGLWGSMGEDIICSDNTTEICGDVGNDAEACRNVKFVNSTINRCGFANPNDPGAALAVFYGSENVQFINPHVTQGTSDGHGFKAFGNFASKNVSIMGGFIIATHPTRDTIFCEDAMLTGFLMGGGLKIFSAARGCFFQRASNVTLSAPFYMESGCGNGDGVNTSILVQGGDRFQALGIELVYTGSGNTQGLVLRDGATGIQTNALLDGVKTRNFQGGLYNDQFGGGSGNLFINNVMPNINIASGSPIYSKRFNRNSAGAFIDGTTLN